MNSRSWWIVVFPIGIVAIVVLLGLIFYFNAG